MEHGVDDVGHDNVEGGRGEALPPENHTQATSLASLKRNWNVRVTAATTLFFHNLDEEDLSTCEQMLLQLGVVVDFGKAGAGGKLGEMKELPKIPLRRQKTGVTGRASKGPKDFKEDSVGERNGRQRSGQGARVPMGTGSWKTKEGRKEEWATELGFHV